MFTQSERIMKRFKELVEDGYLLRGTGPNTMILTEKGFLDLAAHAERPIKKSDLKKDDQPCRTTIISTRPT